MLPEFVIGIDISKLTLDVAVLKGEVLIQTRKIENSEAGIKQLLAGLRSDYECTAENTVYCAEHMGIYAQFIREVLGKKNVRLCLESPLRIK
jgi:transposase